MTRVSSLDAALEAAALADGACPSFHHHLRNGDRVLNAVLEACAARGLRDLHVAASALFPVHAPLVRHIAAGTVTRLSAGYISGPVAAAVSAGRLPNPVRLQTHGGRAREVADGDLKIDAAFVAASAATKSGALSARSGPHAFGAMGYPEADTRHARCVIGVTDHLVTRLEDADIPAERVDHVICVDRIGDPSGILSGTTRPAEDDASRAIADLAVRAIAASGLIRDGFSFQTGAGGLALRCAAGLGDALAEGSYKGSFASGGITGAHVALLQAGLLEQILDVQCFDLDAVASIRCDPRHVGLTANEYAAPGGQAAVDRLSCVILGAAEVDAAFNVNVTTGSDGVLRGGSGGHTDTAQGAALTVIATRLTAAGHAKLVEHVTHVTTPGRHVDLVATEAGLSVSPRRPELADRLHRAGLPVVPIETLIAQALRQATRPARHCPNGRIVAESFDRHGMKTDSVPGRHI